jgi:hypothetical protein
VENTAMSKPDLKDTKFNAHVEAIEQHKTLLAKLHLESDADLAQAKASLERLAITLEEYFKILGIP